MDGQGGEGHKKKNMATSSRLRAEPRGGNGGGKGSDENTSTHEGKLSMDQITTDLLNMNQGKTAPSAEGERGPKARNTRLATGGCKR